jgi:uncharacterized protein involved in response to NO
MKFRMTVPAAMPPALARRRDYVGPVLFAYGFRPFFLGAALWSAVGILLWVRQYFGEISLPLGMNALDWHIHEMIYGYVAAAIAGFLLTAIPNWTGRLPVCGLPLAGLALLWAAGRLAMFTSATVGAVSAAVIDVSFLVVLAAFALREIVAGRNWRNLRVLGVLGVLVAGNVVWHVELLRVGAGNYGVRIAIAAVVGMIMFIGGRIVPSFTRNWLARGNPGRLPIPFGKFDGVVIAVSTAALCIWVIAPDGSVSGITLLVASILQALRLARWAGHRTTRERLVLVLHVAYAFVPLGFCFTALAAFGVIQPSPGLHAWMAGAVGTMTLAVMTRASLGHTGHALVAGAGTQAIYAAVVVAALARVAAGLLPEWTLAPIHVAAFAWIAAFAGFAILYGPMLFRARHV